MAKIITIRVPEELATWLNEAARKAGVSKARLIRDELERARRSEQHAFMSLAGAGHDGLARPRQPAA